MNPTIHRLLTAFIPSLTLLSPALAQDQRGYYDAPWTRYEAEPELCSTTGTFLLPPSPYTQEPLQAEASNATAVELSAQGQSVSWVCDAPGRGLSIRFSLPDSEDGNGLTGLLSISVDDEEVDQVALSSYWAWQYSAKAHASIKYPDNEPSADKFARMRFDEVYVLLPTDINEGQTLTLTKADATDTPFTIDFVELEEVAAPLTINDIEADNKVTYSGDGSDLQSFINHHGGYTIFLPAGEYTTTRRLQISDDNTSLIGAGMWHTSIYFSASSENRSTYSQRGIETNASGVRVEGMTLNTVNRQRYYDNNSNYQVGKAFMGSWGTGSRIRDVRADHFECGAWIADYSGAATDGLEISYCRFRNNYADGVNLCSGVENSIVSHCSFRNNGDDDMAIWSSSTSKMSAHNTFSYCTAENNWRASSLAFYGGNDNHAHHILISDALEAGAHANGEFSGSGYGDEGCSMTDISIYRAGCTSGTAGTNGDFWGNANGALYLTGGYYYDLAGLRLEDIDIYDARCDGVMLTCNQRSITSLEMHRVKVYGAGRYGFNYVRSTKGDGRYSDLAATNCGNADFTSIPSAFSFIEVESSIALTPEDKPLPFNIRGHEVIVGDGLQHPVRVYNVEGRCVACTQQRRFTLPRGLYILVAEGYSPSKARISQ
ncbi:MAG: hypothetical protein LIO90_02170 [Bacteroidales bacterium]|nr:hypothetical protein [Bacteroidales bacterium]